MNKKKLTAYLMTAASLAVLAAGATYAWHSSQAEVVNHFEGGKGLRIEVNEAYVETLQLSPAETVDDVITVSNTGKTTALVSVDLDVTGLSFDVEKVGLVGNNTVQNGNLIDYSSDGSTVTIQTNDLATWKVGQYYKDPNANRVYKSATLDKGRLSVDGKGQALTGSLAHYTFQLNAVLDDGSGTQKGWTYVARDGASTDKPDSVREFRYNTPLKPGEKTEPLLEKVTLNYDVPNEFKGSLLNIKTVAWAKESGGA